MNGRHKESGAEALARTLGRDDCELGQAGTSGADKRAVLFSERKDGWGHGCKILSEQQEIRNYHWPRREDGGGKVVWERKTKSYALDLLRRNAC